jgi:hypothetical protein
MTARWPAPSGLHTFGFEHDLGNVRRAVTDMRIDYPVAVDNDYAVWSAVANHYWPALYFADVGANSDRRLPCGSRACGSRPS